MVLDTANALIARDKAAPLRGELARIAPGTSSGPWFDSPLPAHILPRFRAGPSASIEALRAGRW